MKPLVDISLIRLLPVFIPVGVVAVIFLRWKIPVKIVPYASIRMLLQLVLIGFILVFIFETPHPGIVLLILSIMLGFASWIALRPVQEQRKKLYGRVLLALSIGTLTTLVLVITSVINLKPWYEPRYLIPLAGMIFANAMNSVSLCAERFHAEAEKRTSFETARNTALTAGLLPMTNSFLAVGLVSLPGMMTGQILAGIDPMIAIRYQIMVMCMLYGASGISAALYLKFSQRDFNTL